MKFEDHPEAARLQFHTIDNLLLFLRLTETNYIIRMHDNGLFCVGIKNDTEQFRSKDLKRALIQVIIWVKYGDRWFAGPEEWKHNVDADGKEIKKEVVEDVGI